MSSGPSCCFAWASSRRPLPRSLHTITLCGPRLSTATCASTYEVGNSSIESIHRRAGLLCIAAGRVPPNPHRITFLMAYSVAFSHSLADLPAEVRTRVRQNLEEIGRTIESLPVGGVLLESVSQSPMQLGVGGGWRFFFKVEPKNRRLVVTSAAPPHADGAHENAPPK